MSKPTIHELAARAGVSKSLVSLVMRGSPNVSDDRREAVLRAALELGYRPNAVARSLVEGRTRAIGAMEAVEEDGLRVPEDISIVGYDNTRLAQLRHIALTTVHQPRFEIGAAAVRLVLERLEEGRTEARRLVLPPSLVVRSTTGPPGRSVP